MAIRSFTLVSGYRTIFFNDNYENMLLPFSYRAEMSPQLLENQVILCGILLVVFALVGIMKGYDYFSSREGSDESQCKNSSKIKLIYSHFLFPLVVFNYLFAFLSFYFNSLTMLPAQSTFSEILNSLSWLLVIFASGMVFA